ncbi:GNAT family N-acetyltransferase [Solihabitans fulvus]|uniref:GNAT family N-acetyltransferase n=1 Tax=Solihabitans fulvus TaxID=1892852 RepID=A0A5B2XEH8_9PSEU|nr:GNAT family N-acetyltransferase [Solihabitans fulvus]
MTHTIRPGSIADVDTVVALFDEAVRWLVGQDRTGQWGTDSFSGSPKRVEQVRTWAAGGGMWLAENDGLTTGSVTLGEAPDYVPPTDVPELYVAALVGGREPAARGAGRQLLAHARAEAERLGVERVRVDCYAGDDGALVQFYVSAGFTPTDTFLVGDWPGQVLEQRLG